MFEKPARGRFDEDDDDIYGPRPGVNSAMPVPGNTGYSGIVDPPALDPVAPAAPAAPAPYAPKGSALGLEGFDHRNFGTNTPKYVFAKHATGLGAGDRDELLKRLQGDESGFFKNSRFDKDRLVVDGQIDPMFGGINEFDVIRAWDGADSGGGWQWLDPKNPHSLPNGGQRGGSLAGLQGLPGGAQILEGLLGGSGQSDLMSQIQAELQKLMTGQPVSSPGL